MAPQDSDTLTSWKEIAQHLDVTVRTAQEWEKKRGLPVRRVPGGHGRVFVRRNELEDWLLGTGRTSVDGQATPRPLSFRYLLLVSFAAVVVSVCVFAFRYFSNGGHADQPAGWRVASRTLIVVNERGDELWRKQFDEELAAPTYRASAHSNPQFVDVDGDERLEVLVPLRYTDFTKPGPLVCLDSEGRELWRYTADRVVSTAEREYENIYRIEAFLPVDLQSGEKGIAVSSVHYSLFPSQLALISARDGELLAEYWHSGHVGNRTQRLQVGDRNADGQLELYASGVSNSYDSATLLVLDLESMRGASIEENPRYQFKGFDPPNEIARILFPQSSMSKRLDDYNVGTHVWLTPEFVSVSVLESLADPSEPGLIYQLRPDFSLDGVVPNTGFEGAHERLVQEGVLSISLSDEIESLPRLRYLQASGAFVSGR